jgi:hypothetical protein
LDTIQSRRQWPRLDTSGVAQARSVDPLLRVLSLRNLSAGGFAIETDCEVPPGLERSFELQAVTGLTIVARAVAVHCRQGDPGGHSFISGWRFVDAGETAGDVQGLVDILSDELDLYRRDD